MYNYWLDRGLDAVKVLAENFKGRTWWMPDLICDEVLDEVKKRVRNVEFYNINDDFTFSVRVSGDEPKIFYVIDFFGKESRLGREAPPNTIVVKDSVWFPTPFSPVEHNQIWFNSFRKIIRGSKGSTMISPYRLSGPSEVPNAYNHPLLTWHEVGIRFENYYHCKEIFGKLAVDLNQEFPSIFPIKLKNREKVLMDLDVPLPGMWKNKYNLPNNLYNELSFVPLDSRFNKAALSELADKIKKLNT
jgi:hypothetical protein